MCTDHGALNGSEEYLSQGQLARLTGYMDEFDFSIVHRHCNTNALSRRPRRMKECPCKIVSQDGGLIQPQECRQVFLETVFDQHVVNSFPSGE